MAVATMIVGDTAQRGNPVVATVSPLGEIRVENPASNLFLDTFDNAIALDGINKWTSSTGGTGSSVVVSAGQVVLTGGTVANSFAKLTSLLASRGLNGAQVGTFRPSDPGFLLERLNCNVPAPVPVNTLLNVGIGISPATPTIASPMTEFVGFEWTITGKLQAVTYGAGARLLIADLSVSPGPGLPPLQPADAAAHKYFIYFRGDICYWCIDDKDNIVAQFQTGASGPTINALPVLLQAISNGGVASTIQLNGASMGDTAHTGGQQLLYNGYTFEPQASNQDANASLVTLIAQGTGTVTSADILNTNGKGIQLVIDITVITAGTLTVTLQGKDIASGKYYTILVSAALAGVATTRLTVYPGIPVLANVTQNDVLPRTWRISAAAVTGPITATIGASVIN